MSRVLYGYRMRMGRASIYAPEACIVIAILSFPEGCRCKAARSAAEIAGLDIPPNTIKRLVNIITRHRDWYASGQIALDQLPRPELKLAPEKVIPNTLTEYKPKINQNSNKNISEKVTT